MFCREFIPPLLTEKDEIEHDEEEYFPGEVDVPQKDTTDAFDEGNFGR